MSERDGRDGFRIDRIPFAGAAGALAGLGCILILLVGLPPLRWVVVAMVAGGVLLGVGLVMFRR